MVCSVIKVFEKLNQSMYYSVINASLITVVFFACKRNKVRTVVYNISYNKSTSGYRYFT